MGISKQAVSKHLLALVSDGYLRPIDAKARPRIYEATRKPYPIKSTSDHRGWSPVVRAHHTGRLFRLTSPPTRGFPWLWENHWERSGVHYYVVRDLPIETSQGTIVIKSLRYIEGPRSSSITIWVDETEISDVFELEAHEDVATEVSILAVNEISRRTGLRVALPEDPQPTEFATRAPPEVAQRAQEEGIRTDTTWYDRSKTQGEIETTDLDVALTWLTLPDELRILRERQREVRETMVAIGKYAEETNRTLEEISKRIEDLDRRTRFLEDAPEIIDDPPEAMYQ